MKEKIVLTLSPVGKFLRVVAAVDHVKVQRADV